MQRLLLDFGYVLELSDRRNGLTAQQPQQDMSSSKQISSANPPNQTHTVFWESGRSVNEVLTTDIPMLCKNLALGCNGMARILVTIIKNPKLP